MTRPTTPQQLVQIKAASGVAARLATTIITHVPSEEAAQNPDGQPRKLEAKIPIPTKDIVLIKALGSLAANAFSPQT